MSRHSTTYGSQYSRHNKDRGIAGQFRLHGCILHFEKIGRRNSYIIHLDQQLRHPLESHKTIGEFIKLIVNEYQVDE